MARVFFIPWLMVVLALVAGCHQDEPPGDGGPGDIADAGVDADTAVDGDSGCYESLYTHGQLHDFEIVITQQEWDGLVQDMKDYLAEEASRGSVYPGWPVTGRYRRANFIYHGLDGDVSIANVGFRTKGRSTRIIPQDDWGSLHRTHFKVKFNKVLELEDGITPEFEPESEQYKTRNKRRFCRQREMVFRLNLYYSGFGGMWDNSQIREFYSYDLLHRAGVKTSRTGSATLTITIGGGKHYFGVYSLVEEIDKSFLTKRYGKANNDGNLYKCTVGDSGPASLEPVDGVDGPENGNLIFTETRIIGVKDWRTHYRPTYDLKTNEEQPDHQQLLDFIENLNNLNGDDLKAYLQESFVVDGFLRYHAMNFLLGKWDDYGAMGNNYFLYFDNSGKIEFFPCDYDWGLGTDLGLFDTVNVGIYEWPNVFNEFIAFFAGTMGLGLNAGLVNMALENHEYSSPLLEKILQIEEYRIRYEEYLKEFLTPANKLFVYSDYENRFDRQYSLYYSRLDNEIDEGEAMDKSAAVSNYFYQKTRSVVEQLGLNAEDFETGP